MNFNIFLPVLRIASFGSLFLLAACSSSDSDQTVSQSGPPDNIQQLNVGNTISGSLIDGQQTLYRVPSGAEIVLISESGDADLFLTNSPVPASATLLCVSNDFFQEENCTASVDDGELYAVVIGRTDPTTYTLSATTDCSVPSINRWVYRNMLDYYLYADFVPEVDPESFDSTIELIRELRFNELDPFSNVQGAIEQNEFSETGIDFGFGQRWLRDSQGNLRIARVYDDSPFGRAGIQRGDTIVSINNESINDLTNARFFELTGDRDNRIVSNWEVIKADTGVTEFIPVTIGEFTANTVLHVDTFTNDFVDGAIGYLAFESFIRTSEDDLNVAFGQLASDNVTELVLDLRYNSGGLISIAQRLASQIAGPSIDGQTLVSYRYNEKYPQADFDFLGINAVPSLGLDRVIVITSGATASSSELVINSLRPYMEVVTIGSRTTGKTLISQRRTFCGINLNAMEADGVNVNGVSVSGGIAADCFAADDLTRDFGIDAAGDVEGMLGASLDYISDGTCVVDPVFAKRSDTTAQFTDSSPLPATVLDLPRQ